MIKIALAILPAIAMAREGGSGYSGSETTTTTELPGLVRTRSETTPNPSAVADGYAARAPGGPSAGAPVVKKMRFQ